MIQEPCKSLYRNHVSHDTGTM